eukprot:Nitzschia sp. Nitz4//scaffold10_size219509//168433//169684//NITZ4_001450-RA/size219509-augustus-gene-0.281-mRNA-1//-1//CDS//3329532986//1223//frame0
MVETKDHSPDPSETSSKNQPTLVRVWNLVLQEARAVSLWSLMVLALRLTLVFLNYMSSFKQAPKHVRQDWIDEAAFAFLHFHPTRSLVAILEEGLTILSTLVGWSFSWIPFKAYNLQAPGFILANPLLLLWVRDKTGIIPNTPVRICECVMGRISVSDLLMILPVHVVTVVSTYIYLKRILPGPFAIWMDCKSMDYAVATQNWFEFLCLETVYSTIMTTALLVLPVLFRLNHVPRWSMIFLFYPLLQGSVDPTGIASTFSPNVLLANHILMKPPPPISALFMNVHFVGLVLGGVLGGLVMKRLFPDQ